MKEAILRIMLHASDCSRDGRLILSLAGGRKTMSSDMQFAASVFGCHALLHVIDNSEFSKLLKDYAPSDFTAPIPENCSNAVTPLVTGRYVRNSLMDMKFDDTPPVRAADYPIDWPESEKADKELNWLGLLPKAELHCHLGGVLDAPDLIRVPRANHPLLKAYMPELTS